MLGMPLATDDGRMSGVSASDEVKSAGVKLTYDDYVQFPDDGKRHELIDGEHYVTPTPKRPHQQISGNIHWLIRSHLEQHPIGRVFYAPFDVIFSNFDVVEPDLLYMSNERASAVLRDWVHGAPELVIEIASASTRKRDETIKRHLYERFGVSEYWVVDPEVEQIRVYRRAGDVFARALELTREMHDELATPLLPGLVMPLDVIFKE
jgi:Uma2 family endonuclease